MAPPALRSLALAIAAPRTRLAPSRVSACLTAIAEPACSVQRASAVWGAAQADVAGPAPSPKGQAAAMAVMAEIPTNDESAVRFMGFLENERGKDRRRRTRAETVFRM